MSASPRLSSFLGVRLGPRLSHWPRGRHRGLPNRRRGRCRLTAHYYSSRTGWRAPSHHRRRGMRIGMDMIGRDRSNCTNMETELPILALHERIPEPCQLTPDWPEVTRHLRTTSHRGQAFRSIRSMRKSRLCHTRLNNRCPAAWISATIHHQKREESGHRCTCRKHLV